MQKRFAGAFKRVDQGFALGQGGQQIFLHHGLEQFFLVSEVQVDRALGHACRRGHIFQPRGRIAARHEQVERRRHQLLWAGFLAAGPAFGGRLGFSIGHGSNCKSGVSRRTLATDSRITYFPVINVRMVRGWVK